VGGRHYGQGVAIADFDNDGYPDMYVTGYGRAILYHNNGDGTFTDVTAKAVLRTQAMSTSAGWFDYDKDGWLDLLVTNYIDGRRRRICGAANVGRAIVPTAIRATTKGRRPSSIITITTALSPTSATRPGSASPNQRAWAWSWRTSTTMLAGHRHRHDTWPNFLSSNKHDGTFQDVSFVSGLAASEDGRYEAGMGIDART